MNGKASEWLCTNTTWSENNAFMPRDAIITSFYNWVPFSNLTISLIYAFQKMSSVIIVFIICVGETVKKEWGEHGRGVAWLDKKDILILWKTVMTALLRETQAQILYVILNHYVKQNEVYELFIVVQLRFWKICFLTVYKSTICLHNALAIFQMKHTLRPPMTTQ